MPWVSRSIRWSERTAGSFSGVRHIRGLDGEGLHVLIALSVQISERLRRIRTEGRHVHRSCDVVDHPRAGRRWE